MIQQQQEHRIASKNAWQQYKYLVDVIENLLNAQLLLVRLGDIRNLFRTDECWDCGEDDAHHTDDEQVTIRICGKDGINLTFLFKSTRLQSKSRRYIYQ